ncbi:hypothetical protein JTB14_034614 [Gonioctena quinquepunctata]|nr:hypothetical protein JTB14_034614 [Gonioctena quinquepunctata]
MWKITGTLDPKHIINAIEIPQHSGISIYTSATNANYNRDRLTRYIYQYVNYFPVFLLLKDLRSIKQWFEVQLYVDEDVDMHDENGDNQHQQRASPESSILVTR